MIDQHPTHDYYCHMTAHTAQKVSNKRLRWWQGETIHHCVCARIETMVSWVSTFKCHCHAKSKVVIKRHYTLCALHAPLFNSSMNSWRYFVVPHTQHTLPPSAPPASAQRNEMEDVISVMHRISHRDRWRTTSQKRKTTTYVLIEKPRAAVTWIV